MKKLSFLLMLSIFFLSSSHIWSQNSKIIKPTKLEKPYKPSDDADSKINALLIKAKAENKKVFLQAGGNWCVWCLRFNDFVKNNKQVKNMLYKNYLYYHLNYSTENKNVKAFEKYAPEGYKLGYPFFVILNADGKVLATQASDVFEVGVTYDSKKVVDFLQKYIN